ncbi:extracellular solute-binding protein [Eubacteriales bacterium OttesenSCG-928-K08]|nr:extracellular solute-binding protein [Eubacteriales bacterium OttesenSCG-928-K08]
MKKTLALALVVLMMFGVLAGCQPSTPAPSSPSPDAPPVQSDEPAPPPVDTNEPVELVVVTTYGGDDGNRQNYEAAYQAYEVATGNKVLDASDTSNEVFKAKVLTDFETGSEPDVLFYFSGVDSNPFVEAGKVVSIDEIRAEYPEYASNMKDSMLANSPADGKKYSVPVNGYWEGMFTNVKVLEAAGVAIPGADYTWDQFLADCQKIKDAGFTPVGVSLQEVPHYWFEFTIFNHGNVDNHLDMPENGTDAVAQKWAEGLADIKELYDLGYLPVNTLTATDGDTVQLVGDGEAAFLIDGSWKIGWFEQNCADHLEDFIVTYVPSKGGDRKASDVVSGLSSGYFITRKAWDDPAKRDAAVKFVMAMTTDDVVSAFGATSVTALKNGTTPPADASSLTLSALEMLKGTTGAVAAVQDNIPPEIRGVMFNDLKNVITGSKTAATLIDETLAAMNNQ